LYRTVGAMYFYLNDYGIAISNYEKALEIATEINDEYGKAAVMYNIALINQDQERLVQTLKYYFAVLPYWEKLELKHLLEITNFYIANVYNDVGEYDLSVEFAQKAMSLAFELNDTTRIAASYDIMAQNYLSKGDTLSGMDVFEKTIELHRLKNDARNEARVNIMYVESIKNLPIDKKRKLLAASRRYLEQYDPEHQFLVSVYQEMSSICQSIGKPDSARYYMDKAIQQALLTGNTTVLGPIYLDAAKFALTNKELSPAETYFQTALRYNEHVGSATVEQGCYDGLAELYSLKGDHRRAFEIKRKAIHIRDSVAASENRHRMELLQMQHEIKEHQEQQEAEWRAQANTQQQIIERRQRSILLILSALCFLAIFLAIIIRNHRRTRNNNLKLQEQHEEILQIQEELRQSNDELNMYKEYLEDMVRQQTVKQAEKDQQIRNISNNLPGFIFRKITRTDGQTYVSYISNRAEELIGIPVETIIAKKGDPFTMITNEAIVNTLKEKEKESIRTMTSFTFEHQFVKNHQPVWIYYHSLPHLEENGDIVWDGFVIDITEQKNVEMSLEKAKEQAEESDRLKSAFLSNMSHEVRTPMNAILGFIGFIEREDLPAEKRNKYIRIINENIDQLLQLIKNIIDISKLEVGQIAIYATQFALNPLMEDIQQYWEKHMSERNRKPLNIILDDSRFVQPDDMFNDSERLRQVLGNLIDNAIKYTEKGFIRFGYEPSDDPSELLFFVEDTGVGIPKEQHGVIFEYFRQGNDTDLKTYRSGTGLGLSISKGLVERMGGRIWIESVEGQGSTFYFTIQREMRNLI